jgi:hypothetical protein
MEDVSCLVYVDFISSKSSVERIIQELEQKLSIRIIHASCPSDISGPKEDQALHVFSEGNADIGRI